MNKQVSFIGAESLRDMYYDALYSSEIYKNATEAEKRGCFVALTKLLEERERKPFLAPDQETTRKLVEADLVKALTDFIDFTNQD